MLKPGEIIPQPIPALTLPTSGKTVRVRAVDTTALLVCDAGAFVQPLVDGHEKMNMKTMCVMLDHEGPNGMEHVLFDCGARKDFWNGSPQASRMIGGHVPGLDVKYGVDEILQNSGFDLSHLKAIIWSHWHWDHIGDASKFPGSVDIVVGPGFTENFVPGYPENPDGFVLAKDMEGHRIHEPNFDIEVAGFQAHDYFGDGSFYLLDVPGHATGHICGFARTTPDTFVFMGGDCCHYAGAFRPTPYAPLPSQIPTGVLDSFYPTPCPCSLFTIMHPKNDEKDRDSTSSRTTPFYEISRQPCSAYTDGDVAQDSVNRLQPLDAHPRILICLAHDSKLFDDLPMYNDDPSKDIDEWFKWNIKERSRWDFLNELPKGGKPGRKPLLQGLVRDGKRLKWTAEKGFYEVL